MRWVQEIVSITSTTVSPVDIQVEGSVFSAAGFISHNSDVKLIEYGAFGIVPVASKVAPYTEFDAMSMNPDTKQHALFLANSANDWYKYIARLIENPGIRMAMAQQIQRYVWENRGIEHMANQLEEIIEDVRAGKRHKPRLSNSIEDILSGKIEMREPVHSLNISFLNNLTSQQAKKLHEQFTRQQLSTASR
jgi:hypothetical protein